MVLCSAFFLLPRCSCRRLSVRRIVVSMVGKSCLKWKIHRRLLIDASLVVCLFVCFFCLQPWSPRKESATVGSDSGPAGLDSLPGDSSPHSANLEAGLHPSSVGSRGGDGGSSVLSTGSWNYDE